MARENRLWAWLRKAETSFQSNLHMNRIENSVMGGMPDVEGHLLRPGHGQFWLELKSAARPARSTTLVRIKFQPQQAPWLKRRWQIGGNAWVFLQVGHGPDRRLYLIPGIYAESVEMGCTEEELQQFDVLSNVKPCPEQVIMVASENRG